MSDQPCGRCQQPIKSDQASMTGPRIADGTNPPQHVICPPTEVDQNGVDFGWNCVTLRECKCQNLCFGTCKLY